MKNNLYAVILICTILITSGCIKNIPDEATLAGSELSIYPDYSNIDIPVNIAPLNFRINENYSQAIIEIKGNKNSFILKTSSYASIPLKKWKQLLADNSGGTLTITIFLKSGGSWKKYPEFVWNIINSKIDSHLMYRLIEPGYSGWGRMGIYQRNLENFKESVILDNTLTSGNCMNCHTVCKQNPDYLLFHVRNKGGGTFFIRDNEIRKINIKTNEMSYPGTYPAWHPSGKYAVFVSNDVRQSYHTNPDKRTEVFDVASDLVIYDIENNEIISAESISSKTHNESFATFSPDGRRLYFCSVSNSIDLPIDYSSVQYSLMAVDFDPDTRRIGEKIDTLINGPAINKSVSHPHVSPDGRYIMYSMADYGTFQSWNKEANLWLYDLSLEINRPLHEVNSNMSESCNSWSSCSQWIVFSSRREDGLYNRPYISCKKEDGSFGKPFIMPQKNPNHYKSFFKAYNLPELMNGPITVSPYRLAEIVNNPDYNTIQAKTIRR